jgi:hypothetical protein
MSRSASDKSKSISDTIYERALKSAGLNTVPQSNMTEWLAFENALVYRKASTQGGKKCFRLFWLQPQFVQLEIVMRSLEYPGQKSFLALSELEQESLWDLALPSEYVPGTSRPAVDVVPTIYVLTSDSALVFIAGKGRTLKKYTLEQDFDARKAEISWRLDTACFGGRTSRPCARRTMPKSKNSCTNRRSNPRHLSHCVVWQ